MRGTFSEWRGIATGEKQRTQETEFQEGEKNYATIGLESGAGTQETQFYLYSLIPA